jgi:elongation factor P
MIDVNQLRKGATFTEDGDIFKVVNYQHIKPGRGNATIRVQVKNMRTGSNVEKTYSSGTRVEDIRLEGSEVEYLYDDGEFLTFMDQETFDQPQLRRDVFGDDAAYLKEGMRLKLSSYNGEIIDYELPTTVDYEVVEAEMAVAGDTVNNLTKKVKLSTGMEVKAPMFINVGDVIRIKTEDGSYVTRV